MSSDDIAEPTSVIDSNYKNSDNISETLVPSSEPDIAEPEPNGASTDPTLNPVDEENQFIYDSDSGRLICVGSSFDDIPQNIIEKFSQETKILDLSKNRFRSLACIANFPNLEELIMDDNDLDDNSTEFPKLPKLHTLMLNKNRLRDIYKLVEQLRHAYPNLTHLSLLGNEACPYRILSTGKTASTDTNDSPFARSRLDEDYQRYRHVIIFRIPTLKFLDASEISANECHIAKKLGSILYSIAETRKSKSPTTDDDAQDNSRDIYTPLPSTKNAFPSTPTVRENRSKYNGDGSQGNKFVRDEDL